MHCELCGREIRRGYLIRIEGATLIACSDCAERGEIIRPIYEEERPRTGGERRAAAEEERVLVLVEDYGRKIREARERAGMDVKTLAQRLGVKETTLRKIEEGKLTPPDDVARRLERLLGITLYEEIVVEYRGGEEEEEPTLTLGDVVKLRWKR